jgi:PhnB protein
MTRRTHHIPEGFHTVTPYLTVRGAEGLLDFLKSAFGAEETNCTRRPDGTIVHASVRIGDSMIELSEATGEWAPTPCALHLYVEDADALYQSALRAGGTSLYEPADHEYGERSGGVKDPAGNNWYIATFIGSVPEEESAAAGR